MPLSCANEAVRLADDTDGLNVIASTRLALAAVLRLADLEDEAETAIREAIAFFERKGTSLAACTRASLLKHQQVACMTKGPQCGPFVACVTLRSVTNGRPVGVCDERSRECEQTDCEHDERAVQ